jgi:hypothetical protein
LSWSVGIVATVSASVKDRPFYLSVTCANERRMALVTIEAKCNAVGYSTFLLADVARAPGQIGHDSLTELSAVTTLKVCLNVDSFGL